GGVIDRIRVDAAAIARKCNATLLRDAAVRALSYHQRFHVLAIDSDGVIGLITDFGMAFGTRLNVIADAAEPHQFAFALEQGRHQLDRRHRWFVDAGKRRDLWRHIDRLRGARENAPTL